MSQAVIDAITRKYLESGEFNGYPVSVLKKEFNIDDNVAKDLIVDLVRARCVDVVLGNIHPNPHIKAFSDTTAEQQIEYLEELPLSDNCCLYPSKETLSKNKQGSDYSSQPYTEQLAIGGGQLDFRVFDLSVLEWYRNDPRYCYETNFISGKIVVKDEYLETISEHDQVLLETFGFAHDKEGNRFVAAFLWYLSKLSPEHQKIWKCKELSGDYRIHPDYLRTTMGGEWGTKLSVFEAFNQEMVVINAMSALMGKPQLFKATYEDNYPRNFGFLLRPTLAEFSSFVLLLDKLMSDNLNQKFFTPELDVKDKDGRPKGTISLLEEWVRLSFQPEQPELLENMFAAFRKVRSLRQKPAHVVQEDQFDQKYFHDQRSLVIEAYSAVRTLRLVLANHPSVKANPPEIHEFLREGKIWNE